jgi:SMI1-KNR4 cell-wall
MQYTMDPIPPPSKQYIDGMEKWYRIKLPKDYLTFIRQDNGGRPHNRCFDTQNNAKVIDRFMPIMDDPNSHPFGYCEVGVVWSQISDRMGNGPDDYGSKMLPIVGLEFGDYVCFDWRRSPKEPEVVLWDHEQSRPRKAPHIEIIAKSFTEFLGKLKPLPPFDESLLNEQ